MEKLNTKVFECPKLEKENSFASIYSGANLFARKTNGAFTEEDLRYIDKHLDDRTMEECFRILEEAIVYHKNDPCLDRAVYDSWLKLSDCHKNDKLDEETMYKAKFESFLIHEWSPYEEVRAVTLPSMDSGNCETLRVYVLGIFWACVGSCLDTFFMTRFPSIGLGTGAIQLILAFCGKMWARAAHYRYKRPGGGRLNSDQNPWSFKEQMLASLAVSVSLGSPYAANAIIAQSNDYFYGFGAAKSIGYMVMLTLSSTFMGFGLAGLSRAFLVYPSKFVWYGVLPTIALNRTLVESQPRRNIHGWKLTRYEFFGIFFICSFLWYWVTNYFFQALSFFDWPAWIAPNNVSLQAITGFSDGLGLSPLPTLDWNNIGSWSMIQPFYVSMNGLAGLILSMLAILLMWYTNTCWTAHLPINSSSLFANDGKLFDVSRILNTKGELDNEKYQKYSLPFWSAGAVISYGLYFMYYPALMVYTLLNYGGLMRDGIMDFMKAFYHPHRALEVNKDRFSRDQRQHAEVPEWWFLLMLAFSLGLAIATVKYYAFTDTPVWTIFLGIGLSIIFVVPSGYLLAITSSGLSLNVLFELLIGYALPGKGNALMVSKVFGTTFMDQVDNYITNQKQAHYTGIPPRALFRVQILSCVAVSLVQCCIVYWQVNGGIHDLCNPKHSKKFSCMMQRVYFNAAVQWGTIGPRRVFEGLYPMMKYCFLFGAIYPVIFYSVRYVCSITGVKGAALSRKLENVNEMVLLSQAQGWAPSNWTYKLVGFYQSFVFQFFIKRDYPDWWEMYNYVLANALDIGTAYSALVMFFATSYGNTGLNWWGNRVPYETADFRGEAARLKVLPGSHFGPKPGTYP